MKTAFALALLALFAALPAAAATPDAAVDATLFLPQPVEQAGPQCAPGEQEFGTTFEFVFYAPECDAQCQTYCEDGGGYVLEARHVGRGHFCDCRCCR